MTLPGSPDGINTNTYVSFGLLIAILAGFATVISTIYSAKTDITTRQQRFEDKVDNLGMRVDKFEKFQETWSYQDMFKWAVHLQRDNPQMKVPEPDAPGTIK